MKLKADKRDIVGKKVKTLRNEGKLPAAVCGPLKESESIVIDAKEFSKLFDEVGYNKFIDLEIPGEKKPAKVLIKEIQMDRLKDEYISVSFYQVDEDRKITVEVPIELEGEAPAVKRNKGFLVQNMYSVPLYCLPKDVPGEFTVNIEGLAETGDFIALETLELNEGVEFATGVNPRMSMVYIAARQKEIVVEETDVLLNADGEPVEGEAPAEVEESEATPAEGASTEEK